MIGIAGMICGLCMIVSGEIGGFVGAREQGYEMGAAACAVIMGIAVLLNPNQRQRNQRQRNRARNQV